MKSEQQAAVVVFLDEQGRVLMHNRSRIAATDEEWGFLGGMVVDGEKPEDFAKRKVQLEVGYYPQRVFFFRQYKPDPEKGDPYVVDVFTASFPGMHRFQDSDSVKRDELRMFSPQEAKRLKVIPLAYQILDDLAQQ